MLKKVTIYGERCSGTNYLETLISINFDIDITWEYGWKHFFGFQDLNNSDDTLFICIVRNLPDWINSFYRDKHHLPLIFLEHNLDKFLNNEIWSVHMDDNTKEVMEDRNIYTGERYKNIFELRHTKIKWMVEDLPKKIKNYIFIKYEDLIQDFNGTMFKIKNSGLELNVKKDIDFPLNSPYYKKDKTVKFHRKTNTIPTEFILRNPNLIPLYERRLNLLKSLKSLI